MHSLQRPSRLKAALLLVSLLGLGGTASAATQVDNAWAVSYTHLTLPTIYSV